MEKLREDKEKLDKIEGNCKMCHAKMCNICPNNRLKNSLKKSIENFEGNYKEKRFWARLKEFIK